MEFAIQVLGFVVGLALELLIVSALVRGPYKRYPFVFAYTITNFFTTIIELRLYVGLRLHEPRSGYWYPWYYWRDEGVLQLLLFAVVISLIYRATAQSRARRVVLLGLAPAAVLFAGVSFLIHHQPHALIGVWMTPWTRDLYVCSTVLDLALWAILIAAKKKDYRLLMVSGALGIQFTGEAIGGSLRNLATGSQSHAWMLPGNLLILVANLTAMFIWWQAFREKSSGGHSLPPPASPKISEPPHGRAAH